MKDVVLPQALRISLPATIGFLVQLIKGTSLAAIVGFTELTRAGNIVSNQIFKPLLVFGIVGALYFVICWPLSLLRRAAGAPVRRGHAMSGRQSPEDQTQFNQGETIMTKATFKTAQSPPMSCSQAPPRSRRPR